jgi:hypothetical protein
MAARTIVTSHPDVACDVCGRRLLRGEQPDTFLGGGQRRVVCELCTTRAAQEGWRRESEQHAAGPRAKAPQRGRSLLERLRQSRRAAAGPDTTQGDPSRHRSTLREPALPDPSFDDLTLRDPALPAGGGIDAEWTSVEEEWVESEPGWGGAEETEESDAGVKRALEVFNGGEYPRRLAGMMRSLGEPVVRAAAVTGTSVTILVAWELCWYRYEVDLGDEARGARLTAEGTELGELEPEDLLANAAANERGELSTTR